MKSNLFNKTIHGITYNTDTDLCVSWLPVYEEGFDNFAWFQLWRTPDGHYYFLLEANTDMLYHTEKVLFFTPASTGDANYWLRKSNQLFFGLYKPDGCSQELYEQILTELNCAPEGTISPDFIIDDDDYQIALDKCDDEDEIPF